MRMSPRSEQKSAPQFQTPGLKPSIEVSSLDLLMMMETIEPTEEIGVPPTAAPQGRPKAGRA
jgi:hypothetical protein